MSTVYSIDPGPYQINKKMKWGGGLLSYETRVSQDNSFMFAIDNNRILNILKSNGEKQSLFQLADIIDTITITLDDFSGKTNWDGSGSNKVIEFYNMECFDMVFGTNNEVRITLDNCPNDILDVVGLYYDVEDYYNEDYVTLKWYNESKQIGITTYGYYGDSILSIYLLAGNPSKVRYRIAPSIKIYTFDSHEPF